MSLKYRNRFWFVIFHPKATLRLAKRVWKILKEKPPKHRVDT